MCSFWKYTGPHWSTDCSLVKMSGDYPLLNTDRLNLPSRSLYSASAKADVAIDSSVGIRRASGEHA